jgi:hypothetical protein
LLRINLRFLRGLRGCVHDRRPRCGCESWRCQTPRTDYPPFSISCRDGRDACHRPLRRPLPYSRGKPACRALIETDQRVAVIDFSLARHHRQLRDGPCWAATHHDDIGQWRAVGCARRARRFTRLSRMLVAFEHNSIEPILGVLAVRTTHLQSLDRQHRHYRTAGKLA